LIPPSYLFHSFYLKISLSENFATEPPKLTGKFGNNKVLLSGEIILAIGLFLLAISNPANGYWQTIFVPMVILGLGKG